MCASFEDLIMKLLTLGISHERLANQRDPLVSHSFLNSFLNIV